MKPSVCMQDVADLAGVSRSAVSLALRNHSSISPETRERVRKFADELGYRPNPLVAALMRQHRSARDVRPKHLILALVLKCSKADDWQRFLSPDLIAGAARRASELGYRLEEFWLDDLGWSGARLGETLFNRNVPGLIIAPLPFASGRLRLAWDKFSSVAVGYSLSSPQLHRVTSDRHQAMQLAVQKLRERGYRRIGLALDADQDARVHHQWVAAFLWEQMHSLSADRVPLFVVGAKFWTERRFAEWFQEHRPEVILGYDAGIIGWLENLGKEVPDDVAFAHLWNPDESGSYAGLHHHPAGIGIAAVDHLVSLIERNDRGVPRSAHTLQLEASWVEGSTARALGQPGAIRSDILPAGC